MTWYIPIGYHVARVPQYFYHLALALLGEVCTGPAVGLISFLIGGMLNGIVTWYCDWWQSINQGLLVGPGDGRLLRDVCLLGPTAEAKLWSRI